jgi:UDP-N-acetylglucosamine:LPS N-acetylglucosamine transferase
MKALKFFDEILYIGDFGTVNIPSYLVDKISPIGPIIRPLKWSKNDRELARKELSIGTDKFVISVMPGGWATEAKSPIYTLALSAFELLLDQDIQVLWMAGNDFETVRTELALYPNIQVRPYDPVIERVMVASDIAITKANRVTVQELDFLGIPSISLSDRANSVGDLLISKISSVLQLVQAELTAQQLADHIKSAMVDEKIHQPNIRRHLGSKSLDTLTDRILERLP